MKHLLDKSSNDQSTHQQIGGGKISFYWEKWEHDGHQMYHVWLDGKEDTTIGATAPNLMQAISIAAADLALREMQQHANRLRTQAAHDTLILKSQDQKDKAKDDETPVE